MPFFLLLPSVAATLALVLAAVSLLRKRPTIATWCFAAGMTALAVDSGFTGIALRADSAPDVDEWLTLAAIAKAAAPALWLAFSLTYSRGNYRQFLGRWLVPLVLAGVVPVAMSIVFRDSLVDVIPALDAADADQWWIRTSGVVKIVNAVLLGALAFVLVNLEQTFRAAVGTQRWRIKYVMLGLSVIFGAHVYVRTQAVLFSVQDIRMMGIEPIALLVGCIFLVVAYARAGLDEIDVYPSLAVMRSSLTVVILGVYLFVVGVLAEVARYLGGVASFQFQALIVLLGLAGLAVLLMSDRLRQAVRRFAARHFSKAQYDSARVWTRFSQRLAKVRDRDSLCREASRLVSETFDVLAVTCWLVDDDGCRLVAGASTASRQQEGEPEPAADHRAPVTSAAPLTALWMMVAPFDLEGLSEPWAEELKRLNPTQFAKGGRRWCVPLRAGDECLGALVLADRVSGVDYTLEELELLGCIGAQVASVLVNLRLVDEVGRARELEAFRTMSAFFVHDLKNTASSLNLMLSNLPLHFDDPDFRQDALRSVGNTALRIEEMIARLSSLRQQPDVTLEQADMNAVVNGALHRIGPLDGVELTRELQPLPGVRLDREQFASVVSNLVLNARDAAAGRPGASIAVRTEVLGGGAAGEAPGRGEGVVPSTVVLIVRDNGVGMAPEFVRDSLFKPFQSTKKRGLGIGMFQARMIVAKHGGSIQVESEPGVGTTMRVSLPAGDR